MENLNMNCPQCGSILILHSALARLITCHHCASTLLVEPNGLIFSDIKSQIQNKLSLIKQGEKIIWKKQQFYPQGFIQLKHDEGFRKEWWLLDEQEKSYWLSEEDESFFLLQDTKIKEYVPAWSSLQVNTRLHLADKNWLVTEKRAHVFSGFQGQIQYLPQQEEILNYTYLIGENARSLVLIFSSNKIRCRQGFWLDPFEIEARS